MSPFNDTIRIDEEYTPTPDIEMAILDADAAFIQKRFRELGLVATCAFCGSEVEGLPPGAKCVTPCAKCKEIEELNQKSQEVGLPTKGDTSPVLAESGRRKLITPDEIPGAGGAL